LIIVPGETVTAEIQQTRRTFLKSSVLPVFGTMLCGDMILAAPEDEKPQPDVLSSIERDVPLMRRSEWTVVAPRLDRMRKAGRFHRLTIHHSGSTKAVHTIKNAVIHDLDGVLTSHRQRRYGDIGYHFIIDYAGRVWEGRSHAFQGAHVLGENEGNLAVMLLGNFDKQKPSEQQLVSMYKTIHALRKQYAIPSKSVYGHRDLGASACPGKNVYSHILKLRKIASV
jgi:hypothetical protein